MFKKIFAMVRKDFLVEASYRLAFLFNIFGILTTLLTYFFINKLFGDRMVAHLEEFGVNYFSYALLSMAFFGYVGAGLGSFSERIHSEQIQGTLEALLVTPTKISTILLSLAIWNLLLATVDMAIYVLLAVFVFGVSFAGMNLFSTFIIFILTIISFSALGIISASFVMVFKRGNPVGWIVNSIEGLICGVYFPLTVLPAWVQLAAKFFPITYAIRAIQLAVYRGYSIAQLSVEAGALLMFSIVLLPASFYIFTYAVKKARRDGTLTHY